ncbi:MAG: flagellar motor switch phosphatase FliY, partial [Firmicutes bacterium]|nr:flagellar motor switch phosphatase FliY [Bacillota bacterium]
MGDILSKAEIDALLGDPETDGGGAGTADKTVESDTSAHLLTDEQKDILGEIGNISMGTAATTLFALLRQKVLITTPRVFVMKWKHIPDYYDRPSVGIRVNYTAGLKGANVLVLKETDVKIIADLMMGGDGAVGGDAGLTDLDMSAISEAMNQMVGSASTSLSSLLDKKIDIDAPRAFRLDFTNESFFDDVGFEPEDDVALVSFRMEVGTLIDSEIM